MPLCQQNRAFLAQTIVNLPRRASLIDIDNQDLQSTANFAGTVIKNHTFVFPLPELRVGISIITEQRIQQGNISLTIMFER